MDLFYILAVLDHRKRDEFNALCRSLSLSLLVTMPGQGTAKAEHLTPYGLTATEKTVFCTVAEGKTADQLFTAAKRKLNLDIPGNGLLFSIPVKSVAGRKTLAYLSHGKEMGGQIEMVFEYELVIAMTEEGQSEALMEAARSAGATGGTVVPIMDATASGEPATAKSVGKAMLYLVVKSEQKAAVMKAVREKAGTGTSEGTICFSLPVSSVAGLTDPETKEW